MQFVRVIITEPLSCDLYHNKYTIMIHTELRKCFKS